MILQKGQKIVGEIYQQQLEVGGEGEGATQGIVRGRWWASSEWWAAAMHVWWGCHPSPHRHWMSQTHSPCLLIRQALHLGRNLMLQYYYHSDDVVYVHYLMYVLLQPITGTFFLAPISLTFAHIFVGVDIQKQSVNIRWTCGEDGLRREIQRAHL